MLFFSDTKPCCDIWILSAPSFGTLSWKHRTEKYDETNQFYPKKLLGTFVREMVAKSESLLQRAAPMPISNYIVQWKVSVNFLLAVFRILFFRFLFFLLLLLLPFSLCSLLGGLIFMSLSLLRFAVFVIELRFQCFEWAFFQVVFGGFMV